MAAFSMARYTGALGITETFTPPACRNRHDCSVAARPTTSVTFTSSKSSQMWSRPAATSRAAAHRAGAMALVSASCSRIVSPEVMARQARCNRGAMSAGS
jgi:hypothetical protein